MGQRGTNCVGGFQKLGAPFRSPHIEDHNTLGSFLRPPIYANNHLSAENQAIYLPELRSGPVKSVAEPSRAVLGCSI